jgi:N-acetyl sugar amidotransferase
MIFCKKCVYPLSAVALSINSDGICSACEAKETEKQSMEMDWIKRKNKFDLIIKEQQRLKIDKSNYDCVIGVSGGKDSYYQVHKIIDEYNLKPLLVTYHGNNYLPEGDYNRDRMRRLFNADHLVFGPSVEKLIELNKFGFYVMGDMNWHAHAGIMTYPVQVALKFNINTIIWGETPYDISGMYDVDDMPEFSKRTREEFSMRGYDWNDVVTDERFNVEEKDLNWLKYPTDDEIQKLNLRGLYIGAYFPWDVKKQTELVINRYGWKQKEGSFQRTYRAISNLDDRYENGVHDLLKFVKFGYGRSSDHASKDIRDGLISREEGIELVKKYDHVVSDDLWYWLEYVGMTENEFWSVADGFRSPRVWKIKNGMWYKSCIWGGEECFGQVYLDQKYWGKYE